MNDTQQIFLVFFAIFWGTEAASWPQWKAFNYPFAFRLKEAHRRLWLSVLLLNLLPILFFGNLLFVLSSPDFAVTNWTPAAAFRLTIHGVVPAFAVFGLHRLWLGIIELRPALFYRRHDRGEPSIPRSLEPTVESLELPVGHGWPDILFGLLYVVLSLLAPHVFR